MNAQEALEKVKDAERKAEEIIKIAQDVARKIISQAKAQAEELIKRREEEAREKIISVKGKILSEADNQIQKIEQ